MDLDLSDDESVLQDTFAEFFTKESPPKRVRDAEPLGFDKTLWDKLVELGVITLAVPETLGGGGGRMLDLAIVAQQAGRRLAPVPLAEAASAVSVLAAAGAADLVSDVVNGALPTLALHPACDGVYRLVPAGAVADIVVARHGTDLVALRRHDQPAGARVEPVPNFGSSPIADIRIDDLAQPPIVLASGQQAAALHAEGCAQWKLLMAATLDGLRAAALQMTVDYVKARKAFGVPLGTFQAIQHRLADVSAAGEGGRLLLYQAAWARDQALPTAADLASMAFLFLSEIAFKTCAEGMQFHGGYGYTLEYDIQLFFRRAKAWPLAVADPHRGLQHLAVRLCPEPQE